MAGANAVLKGALGRSKSGSSFRGRSTRRSTVGDHSNDKTVGYSSGVNNHLALGGTVLANSTNQGRTWQTFGKSK